MSSATPPKTAVQEPGMRVKLEATGISSSWRKQELIGVIRQLSDDQADEQLRKRPTGSCILRIDDKVGKDEKTPLVVSYKYASMTFHRRLKTLIRVRQKDNFLVCKTDAKTFKWLQTTLFPFLDQVTVFINEFCANKNFIERELRDVDPERELTFRRFLICPDYGPITLIKKAEEVKHGSKSVSVAIDFNECQFLVIKNSEVVNTISSFNEILLDFLNIRAVDTFLVIRALGYNPQALKETVARDRSYSFAQTREAPRIDASAAAMMSSKDKASMVAMIDEHVQNLPGQLPTTNSTSSSGSISSSNSMNELPDGLIDAISTIQNAIQLLEAKPAAQKKWEGKVVNAERMQWVQHGVFLSLIALVCRVSTNPAFSEIVNQSVDIIKMLIRNFPPGCEAFYKTLWAHQQMSPGSETFVGISFLLSEVISTHPFSQIFLAESGVAKMLDLYNSIATVSAPGTAKRQNISYKPSVGRMLRTNSIFGSKPSKKPTDKGQSDSLTSVGSNDSNASGGSDGDKRNTPPQSPLAASADPIRGAKKAGRRSRTGSTPQKMHSMMIPRPVISPVRTPRDDSILNSTRTNSSPNQVAPRSPKEEGSDSSSTETSRSKVPRLQLGLGLGSGTAGPSARTRPSGRTGSNDLPRGSDADEGIFARLKELIAAKDAAASSLGMEDTSFIQDRLPSEELAALSKKLGETYMTNDLATILPYKEFADARAQRQRQRQESLDEETSAQKLALETYRSSPVYLVKCNVLKTLASLSEEPQFKQYARSPMNLLFSELTQSYKDTMLRDDSRYRSLIFRILQQSADDVEVFYNTSWSERVKGMLPAQAARFRKRLDLFVWRIHTRIISTLETKNFEELEIHLAAMADYIRNCYSRVMASQIVDVCMETLLTIKSYIFKRKIDLTTFRNAKIMHHILGIFDEVALLNKFDPLNDLLATFFLYKEDTYEFVKAYAYQVLGNSEFEKKIVDEYPNGKQLLRDWRIQVIRHYRTCVLIIANHFRSDAVAVDQLKMRLLKKMQFLVYPSGLIQRCLSEGSQYHNFQLKREMLKFLHKLFSIKHCPFVRSKTYIDSYIGFHYMQFIKLYNNYALDPQTLELCRRHLKILIDFSQQKNEEIRLKFYQLRAMDFLVREINLEYEIKVKGRRYQELVARNDAGRKSTTIDAAPVARGPIMLPSGTTLRPIAALMQGELEQREIVSALSGLEKSSSPHGSGPGSEASSFAPTPANSLGATSPLKSPSADSVKDGPLYMSSLPGATVLPAGAFLDDISEESEKLANSFPSPSASLDHSFESAGYRGGRGRSNTLGASPWEPPSSQRSTSVASINSGQTSPSSSSSAVPKLNLNALVAARTAKPSERIFLPTVLDMKLQDADKNRQKRVGDRATSSFSSFGGANTPLSGSTGSIASLPAHVVSPSKISDSQPIVPKPPTENSSSSREEDSDSPKRTSSSGGSGRARAKSVDYSIFMTNKVKSPAKRTTESATPPTSTGKQGSPRAGSLTRKGATNSNDGRNSPARRRPAPPTTEESAMESAYDTMDEDIKRQSVVPSVIPVLLSDDRNSKRSSLELKPKDRRRSVEVPQPTPAPAPVPVVVAAATATGSNSPKDRKKRSSLSLSSSSNSGAASTSATASPAVPTLSPKAGRQSDAAAELSPVPEASTPSETPRSGEDFEHETSESTDAHSKRQAVKPPVVKAVPKLSLGILGAMKGTPVSSDAKPMIAAQTAAVEHASEAAAPSPKGSPKGSPKSSPSKRKNAPLRLSIGGVTEIPAPAAEPPKPETKTPASKPKMGLPSLGMKIGALSVQKGQLLTGAVATDPVAPAPAPAAPANPPAVASDPTPSVAASKKKPAIPPMALGGLKLDKASTAAAAAAPTEAPAPAILSPTTEEKGADRRMTLTALERGTSRAGKFQVLKKEAATSNAAGSSTNRPEKGMSSPSTNEGASRPSEIRQVEERLYASERDNRKLYADDKLHESILELIFFLLIAPNGFTLDSLYTHQYPITNVKMNVPFTMGLHLAHPMNKKVLGPLAKRTQRANESAFRLLRLLSMRFFQPSLYKDLDRIAEGAYGTVYAAKLLGDDVAVKLMSVPRSIHDRCVLHDIFTEILVLDKWKADERICKMIDYGVDDEHYWIVMKRYKTSLRSWRVKQTAPLEEMLPLYLNIFSDVLNCVNFLSKNPANIGVNHYDIKCDNFLINPYDPNLPEAEFYHPKSDTPPFSVCLADFGESIVYTNERESYTIDNRGTEFIKSPEMLTIAYASNQERQTYDRRKKVGASTPSDIWSIGCLLYELLTGEFLFFDEDWVRFWLRVTTNTQDLISQKKKEAINHNQPIINFLQWVLIRDAAYRPSYHDLIQRFSSLKQEVLEDLRRRRASDAISPKSSGSLSDPLLSPGTDGTLSPKVLTPKSPESARQKKSEEPDSRPETPTSGRTSARRAQMARQMSEAIQRPKKKLRPESLQIASLDIADSSSPRDEDGNQSARASSEARRRPANKLRTSGEEKKRRSSVSVTIKEPSKTDGEKSEKPSEKSTPRTPKTTRTESASPREPNSARVVESLPEVDSNDQRRSSDSDIVRSSARDSIGGKNDSEQAELLALRQQVLAITGGATATDAPIRPASTTGSSTSSAAESTDTEDDTPRTGSATPDSPHSPTDPSKESGNTSGPEPQSPHLIRVGKKKQAANGTSPQTGTTKGNKSSRGVKGHQRAKTAGVPPLALGGSDEATDANGASPRSTPVSSAKAKVPPLALNLGGLGKPVSTAPEVIGDQSAASPSLNSPSGALSSGKKPAIPRLSLQLGPSLTSSAPKPSIPVLSMAAKEPAANGSSAPPAVVAQPRGSVDLGNSSMNATGSVVPSISQQSVMVDKPKILTQHDLPSMLSMPHFDQGELNWYENDPSQIYNHIWLGSYDCTADKSRLKFKFGITHIINCSNKPNLHPMHFSYEQLIVGDNADTPITSQVSKILIFVREAEKAKGRVLITEPNAPDTSIGAALAVALVMKLSPKKLSFYEAYRHVNAKRYISWMHPQYVQQLCEWNFARFVDLKKNYRQDYRCICGNNSWTMLQPFDASAAANPLPCSCSWNVGSSCPNIDCQGFLDEMAHYHSFKASNVLWGYTSFENVVGDFEDTDEFNPADKFSFQQREFIEEKEWKLFRCRRCNFITHAIRASNPNIVAVVANIPRKI